MAEEPSNLIVQQETWEDKIMRSIFDATVALVPDMGVSDKALLRACANLNLEAYVCLFPDGIKDILRLMYRLLKQQMDMARSGSPNFVEGRVRDKVGLMLKTCAMYHASLPNYRMVTKELLVFLLLPKNTLFAASLFFSVSDTVWRLAGVEDSGFSYYTKRFSVTAIYVAMLVHLSNDSSQSIEDTCTFIDRRIENVLAFHKATYAIKSMIKRKAGMFDVNF